MKIRLSSILILAVLSSNLFAQQRIVGGHPVDIADAPWQVFIKDKGNNYFGSGIIIAPDLILTTNRWGEFTEEGTGWRYPFNADYIEVITGITCKDEINSGNTYNVSHIIPHPTIYNSGVRYDANIALLRLSESIAYSSTIKSANYLAASDATLYNAGRTVRVSGWGWQTHNGNPSDCLNAVDLHIISNQDAASLPVSRLDYLGTHEMVTIGTGNVNQGVCNGDDGAPLVTWSDVHNDYVLIGVVNSDEYNCPYSINSPSVFVRISSILDWIRSYVFVIEGADTICDNSATYTLNDTTAVSSWSIEPADLFTIIDYTPHSVTVQARVPNGQTGTLMAIVDGITVTKTITACSTMFTGSPYVCDTTTYTLEGGFEASDWNVTPGSVFRIIDFSPTSATVITTRRYIRSGTLTALINGISVTKTINTCLTYILGSDSACCDSYYPFEGIKGLPDKVSWSVEPDSIFKITDTVAYVGAVVKTIIPNGQTGILKAMFDGTSTKRTINACLASILGSDVIYCLDTMHINNTYNINGDCFRASSWTVEPPDVFSIKSFDSNSVTIEVLAINGQSGTLTAVINGITATKTISADSVYIAGADSVCCFDTYTINDSLKVSSWKVEPGSVFKITDSNSISAIVERIGGNVGQTGTLTAIVNGIPVKKIIRTCSDSISGSISGPEIVRLSSEYTVENLPRGVTVTWESGPCGYFISNQLNSSCFDCTPSWVEATLNYSGCLVTLARKAVSLGFMDLNFTNQTINTETIVVGCSNINVKNITVAKGAKLELKAPGTIKISGSFKTQSGSKFQTK